MASLLLRRAAGQLGGLFSPHAPGRIRGPACCVLQQRGVKVQVEGRKPPTLIADAMPTIRGFKKRNFDQTIEVAVRLNIDPRKQDQAMRGLAVLPKGTGRNVRVAVFATGPAAEEAKKAGATIVGGDDLVDQVKGGFMEFDRCVATPAMMQSLSKIARILGPRGMMPNPKVGTVTDNMTEAIGGLMSGVTFKAEKAGIIHVPIGKMSFPDEDLLANLEAVLKVLVILRPKGIKEPYIRSCYMSAAMSESLRLDPEEVSLLATGRGLDKDAQKEEVKQVAKTGWVDKAALDWDSVDPQTVVSKKLRRYLEERRKLAAKRQEQGADS